MAKTLKQHNGSSLLIALIVMGILMTLALGVSDILIGTLKDKRLLLDKTKAWYAAESGIEQALLKAAENLPGFEENKKSENGLNYTYSIAATTAQIPPKKSYEIQFPEDTYASLPLNESVTVPLFKSEKEEDRVTHFRVDYYLSPNVKISGGIVPNELDILRWKIFGLANDGVMEVISEFIPANQGNDAESPTCFGTRTGCYVYAKFYKRTLNISGATEFNIIQKFPIETFLQEHKQNFLVITNIVNTDMISGSLSPSDKRKLADIKYRVVEEDGLARFTLPIIKISADGFSGEAKQSLDLDLPREKFLPVFNYALYRTAE